LVAVEGARDASRPRARNQEIRSMSMDRRETYITGLKNAHALEGEALALIDRQLDTLASYPEHAALLRQHRTETERQRATLERILDRNGTSPSTLKNIATSIMGNVAALTHAATGDAILKNTFANFAFEHFEQAAYRSLIALAREVDPQAVPELEGILREEEKTAKAIGEQIEPTTLKYVQLSESGQRAAS
jgi:ferritin-like metal-binding protein YciE